MNAPDRPRHKLMEGKRISTIERANPVAFSITEWQTLLIRFTDGTTAQIEAREVLGAQGAYLEVTVDGY